MRAAPAVDAALADGLQARWLILALHLAAAGVLLAWAASWLRPGLDLRSLSGMSLPAWLAVMAGVLAAAGLGGWQAQRLLPPCPRRLRWDGHGWQLLADGQASGLASVAVQIDLGRHVLLRLRPQAPEQAVAWCVASARTAGHDWHALRVALRYHAGIPAGPALHDAPTRARR